MIGWAILNSFVNGVENTGSEDGMMEFIHNTVIECSESAWVWLGSHHESLIRLRQLESLGDSKSPSPSALLLQFWEEQFMVTL